MSLEVSAEVTAMFQPGSDVEVCVLGDVQHFECAAESQVDCQAEHEC